MSRPDLTKRNRKNRSKTLMKPTPWYTITTLASSRNHRVLSLPSDYQNARSRLTFLCNVCKETWVTSWASYKGAKVSGCPNCKRIRISSVQRGKHVSSQTRELISKANLGKPGTLNNRCRSNHPAWKGGTYDRSVGSTNEAARWRKAVKGRYGGSCFLTGATKNLECHHLNSWCDFPEQRECETNGVLLSKPIHRHFHKRYGNHVTTHHFIEYAFIYWVVGTSWLVFRQTCGDRRI